MGVLGRPAAIGFAIATGVLLSQAAPAQSRSPAGDKGGAKGLAGTVVQFEEKPSRAVIYLEEKGGLVTQLPPRVERPVGDAPGESKVASKDADKAADKAPGKAPAKLADRSGSAASPLRASQAKPAPSAERP